MDQMGRAQQSNVNVLTKSDKVGAKSIRLEIGSDISLIGDHGLASRNFIDFRARFFTYFRSLTDHADHCLASAMASDDQSERERKVAELVSLLLKKA